jgi:hypothetical protein
MWGPVALVAVGVLAPALVEFFDFPLQSRLWLLALAVHPLAYLVALGFVGAAVVVAGNLGTARDVLLVGLVGGLGLGGVVWVDMDHWYPVTNFHLHRDRFARAVVEAQHHRPVDGRSVPLPLPWPLDELARADPEVTSVGGRVVVTAIDSESNGLNHGYLYAPWARRGQVVDLGYRLRPEFPLGSGWWWAGPG